MARHLSQADVVGNLLQIETVTTSDLDDGQPCPPLYEGAVWRAVRRSSGHTLWRRLYLKTKPSHVAIGAQRREP
jgi:hypothetical protein